MKPMREAGVWTTGWQESAPVVVPGVGDSPGVQPVPPPGGGSPPPAQGFPPILWVFLLVLVFMIVLTSLSGRRERKRREAMIAGLKRGDRVQTMGGILGTIVDLTDTDMVLRVDEATNTRVRFMRSAVQQVLRDAAEGPSRDGGGKA